MTRKPPACVAIEPDLIAAATGEAAAPSAARVDAHIARCSSCRNDHAQYRAVDAVVGELRGAISSDSDDARRRLLERLADLRSRLVHYRVFPSPLGPILIARSEQGVSLVEYLARSGVTGSRLFRAAGVEAQEDGTDLDGLHREIMDYLAGRRTRFEWPLDLRLARSEFHRAVLTATAAIPYGAVSSYGGIARDIGHPAAVRGVAQALRHNPVPIVVPCHRIIGSDGHLVGYAGNRIGMKEQLLRVEGVRTIHAGTPRIERRTMYHYDPNPERQYCLPTCGDIARRPLGQVKLFGRREQAEAAGLEPCANCRPDLHELLG